MDNVLLRIVLAGLAVYRLSELLAIDDGPFEMLAAFRGWLNQAPDNHLNVRRNLADGIVCSYCNGMWMATLVAPFVVYSWIITDVLVLILALAGIQSILVRCFGRNE